MTTIPPNSEDFWGKKDSISIARSLRLAVIQNQYDQNNLTKTQAKKCLDSPLSPGKSETIYRDSNCLKIKQGMSDEELSLVIHNSLGQHITNTCTICKENNYTPTCKVAKTLLKDYIAAVKNCDNSYLVGCED